MPIKYVVAVILRSGHRPGQFLTVRRPFEDQEFPGAWGLPAASLLPKESPEDGARRVCVQKLACEAEPIRFLGAMYQKRRGYDLLLMDIEVILIRDTQPAIARANTEGTAYIDQAWSKEPRDLQAGANAGSCCSSIFLTDQGFMDRGDWQLSLGS